MRVLHFPPQRFHTPAPGEHPSPADIGAFIDRLLPHAGRERIERHLADCASCRDELAACARLAASAPRRRRRPIVWSGLGVAAAAALVVGIVGIPRRQPSDVNRERGVAPTVGEIAVVSPRPGSTVDEAGIRFVWRSDPGAVGYKVIVTTPGGTLVWSKELSDSSITPPLATMFAHGEEFYWRVESSRVNGGTAWSNTESFRVARR